ncbi:MAG: hypothetical protein UDP20_08980, partial [Prevotella sp.]|nr:hypothetical protein [Prevotella sp.]
TSDSLDGRRPTGKPECYSLLVSVSQFLKELFLLVLIRLFPESGCKGMTFFAIRQTILQKSFKTG